MAVSEERETDLSSEVPRIGVYGGAFDPVHCGHLAVARAAVVEMSLDSLLFVPTVAPPHKTQETPYAHRLAMLRLALDELAEERFAISAIEEKLPAPSYSINTLLALQKRGGRYFFILGVDAFLGIESWKDWQDILSLVHIVISPRQGYADDELYALLSRLGYVFTGGVFRYCRENGLRKDIFLLQAVPPAVSSSDIKRSLQGNEDKGGQLLPFGVASYILSHNLYKK